MNIGVYFKKAVSICVAILAFLLAFSSCTDEIKQNCLSEDINSYSVSPLAKNINAEVKDKTLKLTISESTYMIVKINKIKELVIVADDAETDVPSSSGEGIYNIVTDFGADNTGKSMAQESIQHAIDAANNAGGGTVYIPDGLYYFDKEICLKSNVSVYLPVELYSEVLKIRIIIHRFSARVALT